MIDSISYDHLRSVERIVDNSLGINESNIIPYEDNEIGSHARRATARAENIQNTGGYAR